MTILFVGNTPADLGVPAAALVTTSTYRDTTYVPNSINMAVSDFTINLPTSTGDIWYHMRWYTGGTTGSVYSVGMAFKDAAGNIAAQIAKNTASASIFVSANGSTSVSGANYTPPANTFVALDVKVSVGGSGGSITIEMYVNGILVSSATATNSGTVKTQPVTITYANIGMRGTANYISEIIVAAGESTIGARLAMLTPTSAGFYATMSGSVAGLADDDTATGVTANTAGQRFNAVMSAYGGPASPTSIRGVFLKSFAQQSGGAPTKLAHSLRIASTDYDGADQSVVAGTPLMTEWATNPNTGAAWATAALAALEGGLKAAA